MEAVRIELKVKVLRDKICGKISLINLNWKASVSELIDIMDLYLYSAHVGIGNITEENRCALTMGSDTIIKINYALLK